MAGQPLELVIPGLRFYNPPLKGGKVVKVGTVFLMLFVWISFSGCESSSSVTATAAEQTPAEESLETAEVEEMVQVDDLKDEPTEEPVVELSQFAREAAEKHQLASQLLEFAGPIEDLSSESTNVRWLAADLLKNSIELDPTEFKYYRDLFMTYMVLQEPVKALEAIEPARNAPALEDQVIEFQALVFGALEFASMIDSES